jgi:signal transduction histidine kinase
VAPLLEDLLGELELFLAGEEPTELQSALVRAHARARRIVRGAKGDKDIHSRAAIVLAAEALAGLAPGGRWSSDDAERLTAVVARHAGLSRPAAVAELFRETVRALGERDLPPAVAVEVLLLALTAFGPVREASLWIRRESTECVFFVGSGRPTRRMRAAAKAALADEPGSREEASGFVHAVPVLRWGRPLAALVFRSRAGDRQLAEAFSEEAAAALGPPLEKDILLERVAQRERALVQAGERRLTRLGFDIHDGPLQDIAALAADLRFFHSQLQGVTRDHVLEDVLLGRLDDFDARLTDLDADLRGLAHSLESPSAGGRALPDVIGKYVESYSRRNGIEVAMDLRGDFDVLSASQRLALARIVQEALTNVREHSGARAADVTVTVGRTTTDAVVRDDGRGFDVERALVRAAERGRLGLVGMAERVRLLGGRLEVDSRPGGPTTVSATIPRWEPIGARDRVAAAS